MIPAKVPDPAITPFACDGLIVDEHGVIVEVVLGVVCSTVKDTKELGLWIANRVARDEALEACNLVREEGAE